MGWGVQKSNCRERDEDSAGVPKEERKRIERRLGRFWRLERDTGFFTELRQSGLKIREAAVFVFFHCVPVGGVKNAVRQDFGVPGRDDGLAVFVLGRSLCVESFRKDIGGQRCFRVLRSTGNLRKQRFAAGQRKAKKYETKEKISNNHFVVRGNSMESRNAGNFLLLFPVPCSLPPLISAQSAKIRKVFQATS